MKIDLHIHSKDCSDGKMSLAEIFEEAKRRKINLLSISDHDSIACQEESMILAAEAGIAYVTGVELNISFSDPRYRKGKPVSLDVLGYQYDIDNKLLLEKLQTLRDYRKKRAEKILEKINAEFLSKNIALFTSNDIRIIEESVEGAFGRPHIADYMVKKRIVKNRQAAFDNYLVKCNVPKMPVSLEEASALIRGAGGKLMLAHPNNPKGTSLVALTASIEEQHQIIKERMFSYIDGIECWHSSHDPETVSAYLKFSRREGLMATGGSDCHQNPVIMGTVAMPVFVAEQFGLQLKQENK
jgi:predicted metal-dependent phosphoesterase TrpH